MLRIFIFMFLMSPVLLAGQNEVGVDSSNLSTMQDWIYPYDVHRLSVSDSIEIAYIDEGQGAETLVFVHGLGSNLKSWQKNVEALRQDYRCIALDLPGYGKSSKGSYPFDMSFFAESIRSFLQALELPSVTVVGHSMGGQIALTLAQNPPECLQGLVLLAPAGFETFSEAEREWFGQISTPAGIRNLTEEQIRTNFNLNFYAFPDDATFMIEDRLLMRSTVEYDHFCQMIPQCVQGMLAEPVFPQLPEVELPALVIFGKEDALIPNQYLHPELTVEAVARAGVEALPAARLELLSPAGHFVQWEQSEDVNGLIQRFLKEN